jgi:hypothetical protein
MEKYADDILMFLSQFRVMNLKFPSNGIISLLSQLYLRNKYRVAKLFSPINGGDNKFFE